ncbi:His-Xaa-Ser system radical SAM maturase HxsB [Roseomonas mucosa]|uniref:His-Xaa-Ser system radical SAM maturase HxsB n=1 Tax=Roseomonas mucosa TaxID=207340 RepID=UPI0018677954|nr:His-Xaa-Ser system radical SAM maturase HxsB [Roseomonas mucosa]
MIAVEISSGTIPPWQAAGRWRTVIEDQAFDPGHRRPPPEHGEIGTGGYGLLPYRSIRIPGLPGQVLLTNDVGEFLFVTEEEISLLHAGQLPMGSPVRDDLLARHMIHEGRTSASIRMLATKLRTRKAFLGEGPSLHIVVPTLRCDHSCLYCQVSRRRVDEPGFEMSREDALAAVDRILESDARHLTVEFQGGEPLLAFGTIRLMTEEIARRAAPGRVTFSMTSTLHHLTPEIATLLSEHRFQISASLDGLADVHDVNRPVPGGMSFEKTVRGVELAREILGPGSVAVITTITRRALDYPEETVDTLVGLGFRSLFLRPISPFGFATRTARRTGYPVQDFLAFYRRALARILELNRSGMEIEEAYAAILLRHIITPFHSGYVDLRSPAGAGLSVLVYDHDGSVYASDEGRMLGAVGDRTFRMGSVHDPLAALMASGAMQELARGGIAEEQPGCRDCAFLPYCGADPVHHHAAQGDVAADRLSSDFCQRHTGLFGLLFTMLATADEWTRDILLGWATGRGSGVQQETAE